MVNDRDETPDERADRRWNETLQEVRVAQTGAQILFGFLLSVAFTPRYAHLGPFDRGLYVVTVALGALATGTLIAPVAYHQLLAGHHLKPQLVKAAGHLVSIGIVLLALTVTFSVLLLLRVATSHWIAWPVTACVTAWFVICWLVMPTLLLRGKSKSRSA
ncbi:DUF6328 family protein [Streptomyces roseus]|uniref:Membrane protein n=1 Tax=Streptomyces roseus TaxID=66430 RepID=A0A0J6XJV6_9ACTN|nr:DUF6328 family protein [Streptomyces roseus]KMO96375.1 membrane protein [Streptomyces roseus]MYT26955.1 hypothetical protein [Streptomyces sp. SID7760]